MLKVSRFAAYTWVVLAYNIFVILWGAYVRATGSGAGCGSHWPLCNGEILPRSPQAETIVEFSHRLTSGLAFLFVLVLFIWAYRKFPRKHIVRLGALLSLVFIITEALVGAGLVLFEWVAQDASTGRVISMAVHLINTFLLLASLSLTGWWATSKQGMSLRNRGIITWLFGVSFLGTLILGVSGAMTALGDTLFPASTLAEGIRQDFSDTAHFLVRLRIWHPVIALLVGSYLIVLSGIMAMFANDELRTLKSGNNEKLQQKDTHLSYLKGFAIFLISMVIIQLMAGLINLLLLAPVWMQLVHLLLADLVWIGLVLLAANQFATLNVNVDDYVENGEIHSEMQGLAVGSGS